MRLVVPSELSIAFTASSQDVRVGKYIQLDCMRYKALLRQIVDDNIRLIKSPKQDLVTWMAAMKMTVSSSLSIAQKHQLMRALLYPDSIHDIDDYIVLHIHIDHVRRVSRKRMRE